jgi:hypothetical protein
VATTSAALTSGPIQLLLFSVLIVVGRALFRRDWLVWVVIWIAIVPYSTPGHAAHPMMDVLVSAIFAAVCLLLFVRYGIFLVAVADSVVALIWVAVPSLDFSRWYALPSVLALAIVTAIAAYGFRGALAGRPLFGRFVLEE